VNGRTLAVLALPVALLISACSDASPKASGAASSPTGAASSPVGSTASPVGSAGATRGTARTSNGGQVTVIVDWPGPTDGAVFEVKLDTHAVDLDPLDLADSVLLNDRRETLPAPSWAAPKGGHHREGALTFEGDAPRFFAGASWIELVLKGIGDVPERTLRWDVGS